MAKKKTARRTTKGTTSTKKRSTKAKPKKTAKKAAKATTKTATKKDDTAVPAGFNTVSPHLSVHDGAQAIAFYQKAFGARPRNIMTMPDGRIMHAELKIGDSVVMLADDLPQAPVKSPRATGGTTSVLHIMASDIDKLWKRATDAGGEVIMPLENQFWEQRYGQLKDPFGHVWALAQNVKMSKKEIETKRRQMKEQMAAATGDPGSTGNGGQERDIFA